KRRRPATMSGDANRSTRRPVRAALAARRYRAPSKKVRSGTSTNHRMWASGSADIEIFRYGAKALQNYGTLHAPEIRTGAPRERDRPDDTRIPHHQFRAQNRGLL